nr:MAG TPA_asm: hypothetical protein [Caudoviricetes sp.]
MEKPGPDSSGRCAQYSDQDLQWRIMVLHTVLSSIQIIRFQNRRVRQHARWWVRPSGS